MTPETRSKYVEYIAGGIRFAEKETGLIWPENTGILTKPWAELSELDTIAGMPVLVTGMESAFDFFPCFNSEEVSSYKLLKAFSEYLQITTMED